VPIHKWPICSEKMDKARIRQYREDLFLVSLPVPIPGFDGFIGSWVFTGDPKVIVDPGPSVTVPALLAALTDLGIGSPDLILLTHIHIDHGGGIGDLAAAFPKSAVVCHPRAVTHLIDPQRLWRGSLDTLGDIARSYGSIQPMAAGQLLSSEQLDTPNIQCLDTPGHAAHHLSFIINDLLFAGEVGGVHLPMDEVPVYLRPATPPRFFLETCLESIDRVLYRAPARICYGHIGLRADAPEMLSAHRDQLLRWRRMVRPFFDGVRGADDLQAMQACSQYLLDNDPLLAGFVHLPPDVQQRERTFMINSIKGYWGYLASSAEQ
jgi:glyoxylase-like metal-dependent hydrolase (beta-lactamase superfamily II)